jgi:hypothetical protein
MHMTMLHTLKLGVFGAALLLGTAAFAGGQTSGPADRTNVAPTTGPAAAGEPGEPGMPGNKSGTTVKPGESGKMKSQTAKKGGAAGQPGMPGNKSGPAVKSPDKY